MSPILITGIKLQEADSTEIICKRVAVGRNPVKMNSIGKNSAVILDPPPKAFHPVPLPSPLMHMETAWKFRDIDARRAHMAAESSIELIVKSNHKGLKAVVIPFTQNW